MAFLLDVKLCSLRRIGISGLKMDIEIRPFFTGVLKNPGLLLKLYRWMILLLRWTPRLGIMWLLIMISSSPKMFDSLKILAS